MVFSVQNLETYKKRDGTSDYGKEFEYLMCAYYALKFASNKNVKDFEMYTNHQSCGDFDDVIIKVKFIDNSVKLYLLQLKHFEQKRNLTSDSLISEKGNFSLLKYLQSYRSVNFKDFKKFPEETFKIYFILYTNKLASFVYDSKMTLNKVDYQIKKPTIDIWDKLINTSDNDNSIFKFEKCEASSTDDYQDFFNQFYLYTNQKNYLNIKTSIHEMTTDFGDIGGMFINFAKRWWEGRFVFTKRDVIMKLSEMALFPSVATLSDDNCSFKSDLLKEAILTFDVTVVEGCVKNNIDEKIWKSTFYKGNFNLNKMIQKYDIVDKQNFTVDQLTPEERSKILWYIDEAPFIIDVDKTDKELIKSVFLLFQESGIKKKLILKGDCKGICFPDEWKIFKNLVCLKNENKKLFRNIISDFRISFRQNGSISIKELIDDDNENIKLLTVKELFLILSTEGSYFSVEDKLEDLPQGYIPRTVSTSLLDAKELLQYSVTKKNLLIINCKDKYSHIENLSRLNNFKIMEIHEYLKQIKSRELNTHTIIISQNEDCTLEQFSQICLNAGRNVHLLKLIKEDCLLLIISHKNEEKFKHCKSSVTFQIEETKIYNIFDGLLNFISAEPGMGKSTTMKFLKNETPPDFWSVFIELKTYSSFFKHKRKIEDVLNEFLMLNVNKKSFLHKIKQILLNRRKIILFLDGLDEMEPHCAHNIMDSIREISLVVGLRVWISAREILLETVEKRLNVSPIWITELNKEQQIDYINTRLKIMYKNEEINDIIKKITRSVNISNNNKILGIPLQLFMITQIYINEKKSHLELDDKMFVLTKLYKMFFKGNIEHYHRKNGFTNDVVIKRDSKFGLKLYTIPALKTCFDDQDFQILNLKSHEISESEKFLDFVKQNSDHYGIIKNVTTEGKAIFHHQTHAEYFACVFLSKNFEKLRLLKDRFFHASYSNLRLLLDLKLGINSPIHLSIIYRNITLAKDCIKSNPIMKDKGGRSPLHLISTYTANYPLNDTTTMKTESSQLQEIVKQLIELCPILEKDELFEWYPFEYGTISHRLFPVLLMLEKENQHIKCKETIDVITSVYGEKVIIYFTTKFNLHNLLRILITKQKIDVNIFQYGYYDRSLLHIAVESEYQNIEIFELLLKNNAKINVKIKQYGITPLYLAAFYAKIDVVKLLIKKGADVNCLTNDGETVLHGACVKGKYELIEYLLNQNIDPNIKEIINGATPLFIAASNGKVDILKLLIRRGADVNCVTRDGWTLLHAASKIGSYEFVEFLLNLHFDPNLKNADGITALYLAAFYRRYKVMKLLIGRGADVNCITHFGRTLLHDAYFSKNYELMKELLNNSGIKPHIKNEKGETVLYLAVCDGDNEAISLLIRKGIDAKDIIHGQMLLYKACITGNCDLIEYLLQSNNIDLNLKNTKGETALYLAVRAKQLGAVKLLMMKNADVNCFTTSGQPILHEAIGGDCDLVKCLLNQEINVNIKNKKRQSALYVAIHKDKNDMAKLLIEKGVEINSISANKQTALHEACIRGNFELVEYLLNCNCHLDLKNNKGETAMHLACRFGQRDIVNSLITRGANINCVTNYKRTVLHEACIEGNVELVEYLLPYNIDVNMKDIFGFSALYLAALNKNFDLIKLLITKGADINTASLDERSILHLACIENNHELIEYLLNLNIDINKKDLLGKTPLHLAVSNGHNEVVKLLVQNGANVNCTTNKGDTLLHEAYLKDCDELVQYLLNHNIDPNIRNEKGETILFLAVRNGSYDIINLLISKGVAVNSVTKCGRTVLHEAYFQENYNLVEYLLHRHADPNIKDMYGATVLYLAVRDNKSDLMRLLISNGAVIDESCK